MNIIGNKKIFLSVSAVLVALSIVSIAVFGLKPGIEFKGGAMWEIRATADSLQSGEASNQKLITEDIGNFFASELKVKNVSVFPSDGSYLIRMDEISEEQHQSFLNALKSKFGGLEELRFESIGPTVGVEIRNKSVWAIVMVLLGISFFVAYAFRKVSYPVKSWKYGVVTLITLFHDVVIPAGLFALLGWKLGIEIDTNFMVALLVVMGFSVHDTIVVFDRIRENLAIHRSAISFDELVNKSVVQTLARSVNTSLTVVIVLLAMFFFGPATLKYFILTLLTGILFGTYSSIFVASPLLTIWHKFGRIKQ